MMSMAGADMPMPIAGTMTRHEHDWLRLAAAPAFALMALLTSMGDGPMPMICSTDASLLTGMVPMYALMSIFHAPPWLKLIANQRMVRGEFSKLKG